MATNYYHRPSKNSTRANQYPRRDGLTLVYSPSAPAITDDGKIE